MCFIFQHTIHILEWKLCTSLFRLYVKCLFHASYGQRDQIKDPDPWQHIRVREPTKLSCPRVLLSQVMKAPSSGCTLPLPLVLLTSSFSTCFQARDRSYTLSYCFCITSDYRVQSGKGYPCPFLSLKLQTLLKTFSLCYLSWRTLMTSCYEKDNFIIYLVSYGLGFLLGSFLWALNYSAELQISYPVSVNSCNML